MFHQSDDTLCHVVVNLHRLFSTPLARYQLVSVHDRPRCTTWNVQRVDHLYIVPNSGSSNASATRCLSDAEMRLCLHRSDTAANARPQLSSLIHIGAGFQCLCNVFQKPYSNFCFSIFRKLLKKFNDLSLIPLRFV